VEGAYPGRCGLEGLAVLVLQPGQRRLERLVPELELSHRMRLHPVEAVGVFEHRLVAARTDLAQDAGHGALHRLVLAGLPRDQRVEPLAEVRGRGIELVDQALVAHRISPS
jgi:hypothetical protein